MIVDLRVYTVRPGQVENFVALYRDYGWPLQQKYLGRCLGWYTSVDGVLNQVVHLWAYDSMADREKRRGEMAGDPAWRDYLKRSSEAGYLLAQETRFLKPTEFFQAK